MKRPVIELLERNSDLLRRARVLSGSTITRKQFPIVELLRCYGAKVDTPRSHADALRLLRANRYDVVISDVSRDDKGSRSDLKGVELAEQVFNGGSMRVLLFTTPGPSRRDRR